MGGRLHYRHLQQEQLAVTVGMELWHLLLELLPVELPEEPHPLEGMEYLAAYHPAYLLRH